MADIVYHFTCISRLPWIIAAKELRPGRNQIGNFPSPDFLWATTRSQGDRMASVSVQGYRNGVTAVVRLTLHAEDFEPWPAITARFPQWTTDHIKRLEQAARHKGETNRDCWRARAEPLPLTRVVRAEAKTYYNWEPVELKCLRHADPELHAISLGDFVYCSFQCVEPGRATEYQMMKLLANEWPYVLTGRQWLERMQARQLDAVPPLC